MTKKVDYDRTEEAFNHFKQIYKKKLNQKKEMANQLKENTIQYGNLITQGKNA